MAAPGIVFVLSGPSGSGKTTIARELVKRNKEVEFSISATTRAPRGQEQDGVDYSFLTKEAFEEAIAAGEFVEYAQVFGGNYYGTPRKPLEEALANGVDIVLDIDVQGGIQILEKLADPVLVFVLPPSRDELEKRLRGRESETEEQIQRRLDEAETELGYYGKYHYAVTNDDLERAIETVQAIRTAEKRRISERRNAEPWNP